MRISKLRTEEKDFDCNTIEAKLASKFTPNGGLIIKMACENNYARADISFEDFISSDQIFDESYQLRISVLYGDIKHVAGRITIEKLQVQPNKVKKIVSNDYGNKFEVDIIYRCHGYNGYNCNYDEIEHPKYKRDPGSKKSVCEAQNVEQCNDLLCSETNKLNCNTGTCYVETFGSRNQYCVCTGKHYGPRCEFELTIPELSEEFLIFSPISELGTPVDTAANECDDNCQTCKSYLDFKVCSELKSDSENYACTGDDCDETCGEHICRMKLNEDKNVIYYERKFSKVYTMESSDN